MARTWADFANLNQDTTSVSGDIQQDDASTIANWISPWIDISQVLDLASGVVSYTATTGSGQIVVKARTSADKVIWNESWTDCLPDGSIPLSTGNWVQIAVNITGGAVLHDLTVYYDDVPAATLLLSGMTPLTEYDFAQLSDTLIWVNAKDSPRKWTGTGASAVLGGSPPLMRFIEVHLNMLWGIEDGNPSRLRYTAALNIESWPALNFIDFNPEDGTDATCLYRFGQILVIGKLRSVATLVGDRSANFAVVWLDHDRGPTGFRAVCTVERFLAYVGTDGIRFSDLTRSTIVSEPLKPTFEDSINTRRLNQAAMVYWQNFLLIALPSADSLYNDTVWVFDTIRRSWARITGWSVSCWVKFRQYGQDILIAGSSTTGQVYRVLTGDDDDGTIVQLDWESGDLDMEYPDRYKTFKEHVLTVIGKVEQQTLQVYYDVVGGTDANGDFADTRTMYTADAITVPAGDGITHVYRILPPNIDAVLGRSLSIRIVTAVEIEAMALDYTVRGRVPGGLA